MKSLIFAVLLLGAVAPPALAASPPGCIAIVGPGSVGGTLGQRWGLAGYPIVYGSRTPAADRVQELVRKSGANARATTPEEAAQACRLLLFAVPWEAAETSLKGLGPLNGKLIIDANNPLDVRDGREIELPVPDSAAERLQAWATGAVVVKAFNTMSWAVMADPRSAAGPVSVPLSGDSAEAKAEVADLVRIVGLEPVDVGPLRTARYTEHMALLYVSMSLRGTPHEFYLRPRKR